MSSRTIEERFWAKVDKSGDCWLWTASKCGNGYGQFVVFKNDHIGAHRFAYELMVGPIPDGLTIDHLCRVRHCVNPSHLEAVTNAENVRRGVAASRWKHPAAELTHCKWGHEFTTENTRVNAKGFRTCRTCARRRALEAYHRKAQAAA